MTWFIAYLAVGFVAAVTGWFGVEVLNDEGEPYVFAGVGLTILLWLPALAIIVVDHLRGDDD